MRRTFKISKNKIKNSKKCNFEKSQKSAFFAKKGQKSVFLPKNVF